MDKNNAADTDDYTLIAHLIGIIFMAGDFKAETENERLLESLLVKTGHRYADWAEVDAINERNERADMLAAAPGVPAPVASNLTAKQIDFIDSVIEVAFEGGDIDGGTIQAWAETAGLLEARTMTEPCTEGQNCRCADGNDFPLTCYQKTYSRHAAPAAPTDRNAIAPSMSMFVSTDDYLEALDKHHGTFPAQLAVPLPADQSAMDAAWSAYQNNPVDLCGDHDAEQRRCVEAAVRAAFAAAPLPLPAGPSEPMLCDFGNPDDFIDAHADWARQKKDEQIGAAEYKGNTISYMYSKAKNYGNVLIDCCTLLGGVGHVTDRIKELLAERDRLAATATPPAAPEVQDAARYRHMRNLTVEQAGAPGQPTIALPNGMKSGYYITEETADYAVDQSIAEAMQRDLAAAPTQTGGAK